MSKPTVPDAVLAERERIAKILYLSGIALPASTEAAIRSGQDAKKFRVGSDQAEASDEQAPLAIATSAGKRPWSEIAARFNARRAAADAESADTTDEAAA